MRKWKRRLMSLILTVMLLTALTGTITASAETTAAAANRFNVVFVIDASGSMKSTDGSLWRYEAINLFLSLATDTGNKVGAVIFNEGIVAEHDLQEINGKDMKESLISELTSSAVGGDTDIGSAIQLAANMLDEQRDTSKPSVIILLSDGNTDLPKDKTGEQLQKSLLNKQDAINKARQGGYPIHTICLNANNAANPAELSDISNATAGQFVEVKNAEDLKTVFSEFYNMIYSTETINIADTPLPDSGMLEIPFTVPPVGVEEVNIIISTLSPNTTYSIFQPSGIAYTRDELEGMTIQAGTFSVIKVPNPPGGTWKIQANGIAGDQVKIDMVFNSNSSVGAEVSPTGPDYALGDKVTFTAQLFTDSNLVTDSSVYALNPATLTIYRTGDNSEFLSSEMHANQGDYTLDLTLNENGDYYAVISVRLDTMIKSSGRILMNVGETQVQASNAPVAANEPSKVWKIKKGNSGMEELDTKGLATDAEDSELTYSIKSSDYPSDQVYLEDGMLKAEKNGLTEGQLTLLAMDSDGLSCDVVIDIEISNGGILGLILKILAAVAALVAVALVVRQVIANSPGNKIYKGDITVTAFDNNNGYREAPENFRPSRGKVLLSRYIMNDGGVDLRQTALQADKDPNYIWLVSSKGLYSSMNQDKKMKKIKLSSGMEVTVSNNRDLESGLIIQYTSDNMF